MGSTVRSALVAVTVLLFAAPVAALQVATPADFCVEVDHSGDNPFGSPSAARAFVTVDPSLAGGQLEAVVSGPTGDVAVVGEVGADGLVVLEIPLSQYGDHAITAAVVDSGGSEVVIDVGSLSFVVDAEEPTCDPGALVYVVPETTTTVPEPTTIVPPAETVTSTPPESTTASVVESTTTTFPVTPAPDEGGGSGGAWALPILGGLILIIGGAIVWRRPGDPCKEQLAAWRAAQAACDAAKAAAVEARSKCTEAETRVEDLDDQRKDLCKEWPPACWDTDDGGWIEESGRPETRITQRDLHLRREALGEVWEQYQAGEMDVEQVEEAWKRADTPAFREETRAKDAAARARLEQLDARVAEAREAALKACAEAESTEAEASAACERAAAAKAAYDACMNAAAPPPAEPVPPAPPTAPTPPPTGPGIAPPPTDPGSTPPPEEDDEDPVCCPEGNWVGYGWTTGGIFGFGVESTIAHFICLCDTGKWITMASRSLRAGLALGGETSLFVAYMWGVEHTAKVPVVWADKSAGGWDFDVSLGPSVTKGLKTVAKDVGKGAGWDYLKWAARNKVAPSDLDPRRIGEVVGGAKGLASSAAKGAAKDVAVGQQLDPQLIVVPVGVGLQVGVWHKWCESVRVSTYRSCGCTPIDWP